MIKKLIITHIKSSLSELGIEFDNIIIQDPRNHEDVDYATNIAMLLSKKLKKNPSDIALDITGIIKQKNSDAINNFIFLSDQSTTTSGKTDANWSQKSGTIRGYELSASKTYSIGDADLMVKLSRDDISAVFDDNTYMPRITPAKNIMSLKEYKSPNNLQKYAIRDPEKALEDHLYKKYGQRFSDYRKK